MHLISLNRAVLSVLKLEKQSWLEAKEEGNRELLPNLFWTLKGVLRLTGLLD